MTREERALRNLKQMCSDGRYLGSGSYAPLEVLEDFNLAIKALEQQAILDKTKEVVAKWKNDNVTDGYAWDCMKEIADIVDKGESEGI